MRTAGWTFCALTGFAVAGSSAIASPVSILPPHSSIGGQTLGELSGVWWKQVEETSKSINPLGDATGAQGFRGNHGDVFFLFGASGGETSERTLPVPANVPLFIPIVNTELDNVGFNRDLTKSELNQVATEYGDTIKHLHVSVDGQALDDLFGHREATPGPVKFKLPADPLIPGYPPLHNSTLEADGYWLAMTLSSGKHTLNFGGDADGSVTFPAGVVAPDATTVPIQFSVDTTYHLTVGTSAVPLPAAFWAGMISAPLVVGAIRRMRKSEQA